MDTFTELFSQWWPAIAALLLAVAKILNTMSEHWTEKSGVFKKAAGFLVELLDLFRVPEIKKKKTDAIPPK